jgi:hypothetical protein
VPENYAWYKLVSNPFLFLVYSYKVDESVMECNVIVFLLNES